LLEIDAIQNLNIEYKHSHNLKTPPGLRKEYITSVWSENFNGIGGQKSITIKRSG